MKRFIIPLLILLIGIVAYAPSFTGKFFFDDEDFVTNNQYVKTFQIGKFFTAQATEGAGKPSNYFRPVQFTTYALLYRAFGMNAMAFHAASIFLHIAAAIVLYFFLVELFSLFHFSLQQSPAKIGIWSLVLGDSRKIGALVISLLFLVHPVQTEAISYISGSSDPLVALFGFLSLLFFLFTFTKKKKLVFLLLSLSSYSLALLSKESGIIFSILILLFPIFLPLKKKDRLLHLVATVPFFLLTITYLLYHRSIEVISMEQAWGNHPYTYSVFIRLAQFFYLIPQYLKVLLFPLHLAYERDFTITILTSPINGISFLVIAVLLFYFVEIGIFFWKKPLFPLLVFTSLSFFASFLPFTGIILINGIMYEHFLYVPMLFFFLTTFLLIVSVLPEKYYKTLFCITCVLLGVLTVRSWVRQYTWADPIRFYTTTLRDAPTSFRIHNNLGRIYHDQGKLDLAEAEYKKVIELNPTLPHGYHNLARMYKDEGRLKDAEPLYLKAIQVDPNFGYSYSDLFDLYTQTKETEKLNTIRTLIKEKFSFQIK